MILELDPLAKAQAQGDSQDRVWYATGVLLDAEDFLDEQTYHRGRLARALAYLYGSGTVAGLRVAWAPAVAPGADPSLPDGLPERIKVEPGLAIDKQASIRSMPVPSIALTGRTEAPPATASTSRTSAAAPVVRSALFRTMPLSQ